MRALQTSCLLIALLVLFGSAGLAAPKSSEYLDEVDPEGASQRAALLALRKEISCLNLLNGLNLTVEQIDKLLALDTRRVDLLKVYASRSRARTKQMETVLRELQPVLETERQIPQHLALKVSGMDRQQLRDRNRLDEQVGELAKGVDGILTKAQLEVVHGFKPCILPPQDLRDPVRAGQASGSHRGESILRDVRGMPAARYRRAKDRIVERHMSFAQEHHGKFTKQELTKERKRLATLLDKVRGMDEVDFELKKDELFGQLKPKNKIGGLIKQIEEAKPGGRRSKAARFMLSPAGVRVLKRMRTTASQR